MEKPCCKVLLQHKDIIKIAIMVLEIGTKLLVWETLIIILSASDGK